MPTTRLGALGRRRPQILLPFRLDLVQKLSYTSIAIIANKVGFGTLILVHKATSIFTGGSSNALMLTEWKFRGIIMRRRPVSLSSCSTAAILRHSMEFVNQTTRSRSGSGASSSLFCRTNSVLAPRTFQAITKLHRNLGFFGSR